MFQLVNTHETSDRLMPGDLVEVRSAADILATLDDKGTLDKLPFMPEMLAFCGRQFRVAREAFKTCVDDQEMRGLEHTVFLEDVRCDGQNHGGCGKACLIFWKEAWLKPAGAVESPNGFAKAKLSESDLFALANRDGQFYCQSSEIVNASTPLPFWHVKQYIWDISRNRVPLRDWMKSLFIAFYNKIAYVSGLNSWGFVSGPDAERLGRQPLNLKSGDLVRIKPLAQIKETLDPSGKHQHLLFAPAMAEFCGQTLRVRNRVDRIVVEGTRKQREILDTVVLEGATCDGVCHRMCPRASLLFWRECWLEKVSQS